VAQTGATPGFDNFYELIHLERSQHHNPAPDLEALRKKSWRADRAGGDYYRQQLAWAKQHNPEIIFVSGWNDWIYGEPSPQDAARLSSAAIRSNRLPNTGSPTLI